MRFTSFLEHPVNSYLLGTFLLFTQKMECKICNCGPVLIRCEIEKLSFDGCCWYMEWDSFPITDLDRPLGLQDLRIPEFLDNQHMKVARLSGLHTGCLNPAGDIPGIHFC
jgi:hypothetical protein